MGDEAKIKKAKGILIGVAIGIFIIVASYSLFRFFIGSAQVPRSATSSTLIR
jgi:hypothetical protein